MLMWVSNRSLIIGMVHIWFCFLFLFCPTLLFSSKFFIHRGTFYFVCTPSLFQPKMKRLVRRRSGQRRVLRARPTPRWRTVRSSPRPRVRTPGRPSREPTRFLTSTSQMFLAESSPPRRLMVTFKIQCLNKSKTQKPLKCMTSKCCTPLVHSFDQYLIYFS